MVLLPRAAKDRSRGLGESASDPALGDRDDDRDEDGACCMCIILQI
jgi:hypothetical protein